LGFKKLEQLPVAKLFRYVDTLMLYKPYMARNFYFEGNIHVPESMDPHRYINMTAKATHQFWDSLFPGTVEDLFILEMIPRGRWDFWWFVFQARNSIEDCVYNYMVIRIFRVLFGTCLTRLATLGGTVRKMVDLCDRYPRDENMVVFVPTYKSELDFAVVQHLGFVLPVLGVDVPSAFDANDLKDPLLGYKLREIKNSFEENATIMATLQEKPSEDGRLSLPDPGLVRALQDSIKEIGDREYTVIPISIEYDQIPEYSVDFSRPKGLKDIFKLYWSVCVMGKVEKKIGSMHVSFGTPMSLTPESDINDFSVQLYRQQLARSVVTEYNNIPLAENHLGIERSSLESALKQLDVHIAVASKEGGAVGEVRMDRALESADEKWFSHFQWMAYFVPYLFDSHPRWATWIGCGDVGEKSVPITSEIEDVVNVIRKVLDEADSLAARAEASLREKTGDYASVSELVAEMKSLCNDKDVLAAPSITVAAAEFVVSNRSNGNMKSDGDEKKNEA